jgi:hypothetical protein
MSIININCCPVATQKPLSSSTPAPTATPTPTVTPTVTITPSQSSILYFNILGNANPTSNPVNTNMFFVSGSRLRITATGSININWPSYPGAYGPEGILAAGIEPNTGITYMALLGKIGINGTIFKVGSSYDSTVSQSGILYLFHGDEATFDNTGFFTACVER